MCGSFCSVGEASHLRLLGSFWCGASHTSGVFPWSPSSTALSFALSRTVSFNFLLVPVHRPPVHTAPPPTAALNPSIAFNSGGNDCPPVQETGLFRHLCLPCHLHVQVSVEPQVLFRHNLHVQVIQVTALNVKSSRSHSGGITLDTSCWLSPAISLAFPCTCSCNTFLRRAVVLLLAHFVRQSIFEEKGYVIRDTVNV
jgi:hypothetical protein